MKSRKLKILEGRLIDSLRERFADPDAEAPVTLRDQPTEVVFTALQPKKPQEDRAGMMGMEMGLGALPQPQEDFDASLYQDPTTTGEATIEAMLGRAGAEQGQAQASMTPQITPPEPTREEMQVLQAQQQQGQQGQGPQQQGGGQQDPRAAIMAALQGAGGGAQGQSAPGQGQPQRRQRTEEESMQDLLVRG